MQIFVGFSVISQNKMITDIKNSLQSINIIITFIMVIPKK